MKITKDTNILIVGLGIIGGSYAKGLTKAGFEVNAIDIDPATIQYALENNNPKFLADPFLQSFVMNSEEDDATSMARTNVSSFITSSMRDFVCGTNNKNINNDAHWQAFLDELNKLGYAEVQAIYQKCYDRQK